MSEVVDKKALSLKVLLTIQKKSGYEVVELVDGFAKVIYDLDSAKTADNPNIVYESDIYNVANFTALAAVNEIDSFVLNANIDYLSQVETSQKELVVEAKVVSSSSGKRYVEVRAMANDIRVFLGEFIVLKLDKRTDLKI